MAEETPNDSGAQADDIPEQTEVADFQVHDQLGTIEDLIPESLLPIWQAIEQYQFIGAAIIIVLGFIVAKLAVWILHNVLGQISRRTRSNLDDQLLKIFSKPAFLTVFFYSLGLAFRSLEISVSISAITIKILASMLIFYWMNALLPASRLVLQALGGLRERFDIIEERTIPLFNIIISIFLVGIAAYALLMIWGINPAAWLASAGVLGIAVGFAAKDTLANLFSGVFIVADTPYKIGDYINLDGGERGQVTHLGMRSTRLLTRDDVEITIPNAIIANSKIINESGGPSTSYRIRIKVGVAYGSDIDQVMDILQRLAEQHGSVCQDPAPRVRMRGFGDSSLDFELLCWIEEPSARGLVSHELYMTIYKQFNAASIEIPYPKRDLYIKEHSSPQQSSHSS